MYYHRESPDDGWNPPEVECWLCDKEECICDALTDAAREDA